MCFYCKGDMKPSTTTHVVTYNDCLIVIKNVPCEECDQCGEIEYSDEITKRLEMIVDNAKKLLQEFSVIDYAKVA
ncbi:MAG: type II toxin-antitoxin system MqsA family antitoxin [Lachnospiraceae bacterium]|nr:type II toxin-antitoxin system MqsA family antitoxin [Lachnospiraceae bacterium]